MRQPLSAARRFSADFRRSDMPRPAAVAEGRVPTAAAPPGISAVFTVYSTQNEAQRALASRFIALVRATEPTLRVHARRLVLRHDDGGDETFVTENWYDALTQKVSYWSHVARAHSGHTVLCNDNDVSLLPGWREAMQVCVHSVRARARAHVSRAACVAMRTACELRCPPPSHPRPHAPPHSARPRARLPLRCASSAKAGTTPSSSPSRAPRRDHAEITTPSVSPSLGSV